MWLIINTGKTSSFFCHIRYFKWFGSFWTEAATNSNHYMAKITMWLVQLHTISPDWLVQSGWLIVFYTDLRISRAAREGINSGSTKRRTSCQIQAQLLWACRGVKALGRERLKWRESVEWILSNIWPWLTTWLCLNMSWFFLLAKCPTLQDKAKDISVCYYQQHEKTENQRHVS